MGVGGRASRRDALKLARLHRAGELSAVHVPDASDEAMRDLCRARTDAVQDLRRGRAQLKAFLLRNGYRYTGKSAWTEARRRYLRELVLPHLAQRVVLEDAIAAIAGAGERIARLEEQMEALLESWPMKPVVQALMGMRGFALVGAMVLASELGGAWRFEHPKQLTAYLGLVPSENTSSEKRRQGGIAKTGNGHARWLLIEAAHHYRLSPKVRGLHSKSGYFAWLERRADAQLKPIVIDLSRCLVCSDCHADRQIEAVKAVIVSRFEYRSWHWNVQTRVSIQNLER